MAPLTETATAYHEAGHAALAAHYRRRIYSASIVPGKDYSGCVRKRIIIDKRIDSRASLVIRRRAEEEARIWFAGSVAQRKYSPRSWRQVHAASDYQKAVGVISYLVASDAELTAYLNLLYVQTQKLLERHWAAIERIASALIAHRTINGSRIKQVVGQAFIMKWTVIMRRKGKRIVVRISPKDQAALRSLRERFPQHSRYGLTETLFSSAIRFLAEESKYGLINGADYRGWRPM